MCIVRDMEGLSLCMKPLELRSYVFDNNLEDAYLVHSFIDGNFLLKEKNKKGPVIATILENTTIWRVLNPTVTREDFLEVFDKNMAFFEDPKSY